MAQRLGRRAGDGGATTSLGASSTANGSMGPARCRWARSLREIAAVLAGLGFKTRKGLPFSASH
jgi:hypothetical protein